MRLKGKTAAITGVASPNGLGFAIAKAFCSQGATVHICDIDAKAAADCSEALNAAGFQSIARRLDVTSEPDWSDFLKPIARDNGRLDILVNNAGISRRALTEDIKIADWRQVIEVNLTGAFLGCQQAIQIMQGQPGGGSIINIASISALAAFPQSSAYGASKGGLRQLSKVVALEGASRKIRCNTIFPGMIATDLLRDLAKTSPDQIAEQTAKIPVGRIGDPSDVAQCAIFLASEESSYMTGAEITVDGGYQI